MIKPRWNRYLLLLALIGVILYASIAVFYGEESEESVGPSISKQQASAAAVAFLKSRFNLHTPETFVVYQTDKTLSGYLQKENLWSEFDNKYSQAFPIEYYQVAVWDSSAKESYQVDVNYENSSIRGWTKAPREAGAQSDRQAAIALAKKEISDRGLNSEQFQLVGDAVPDTKLVFENKAGQPGELKLRLAVEAGGNQVEAFIPTFVVPDTYMEWQDRQDASASQMTWISIALNFLITLTAAAYMIRHRKKIDYRRGVLFTVIFTVISFINNINMYPAYKAMGGNETSAFEIMFQQIFLGIVTLLLGVSMYVSLAAGSLMWQRSGRQLWPFWQEESFGKDVYFAMGRGYLLCLLLLGIQQVLFYIAETKFDMWSVSDPADSPLNMLQPGLFPTLAWVAALSEEATFRLFGIILFKKLVKSDFVAILLPSIIWAAGHTQYPIYPVYTRLIEVSILGIVFGYAFLKFGFFTAIFAHACMDSILMGMSLFSLGETGLTLLGFGYMALPALIACGIAWLHGKRRKPPKPEGLPPRLEAL